MTANQLPLLRGLAKTAAVIAAWLVAGWTGPLAAQTPIHEFTGAPGDAMGYSVNGVGDTNGDGYDDVAVYADHSDFVRIYSGRRGDVLVEITGDAAGVFGVSFTGTGDLDGDGLPDLVIAEPLSDVHAENCGSVHAYSGRGRWLWSLHSPAEGQRFGSDLDCCGDINGDGTDDVIASATEPYTGGTGFALVLSGVDGTPFLRLDGFEDGSHFGYHVVGLGDVDADHVPDLLATTPYEGDAGSGRVFSGATGDLIREHFGREYPDSFGCSADVIGDLDGDRIPDYAISAYAQRLVDGGPRCGTVTAYSGATGAELVRFGGSHEFEQYGGSVAGAGDVNGDGIPDLVVGSLMLDSNLPGDLRRVEIVSGTGDVLYTFSLAHDRDLLGREVDGAGDVNGDGYADVIVGVPWWSASPDSQEGKAFVLGGAEVLLDLRPGAAVGGDKVTLALAGDPSQPFAMFATAVNGVPISVMLMVSSFDRDGAFENRFIIPGNLGSLDLTLQAFALNAQGKTAVSNEELFLLRR